MIRFLKPFFPKKKKTYLVGVPGYSGELLMLDPDEELVITDQPIVEKWEIEFDSNKRDCFQLRRFINGRIDESYVPMDKGRLLISLAAIVEGFEPPRGFKPLEMPEHLRASGVSGPHDEQKSRLNT